MPIFFSLMVLGAIGIVYLAYKDVETAPWNRKRNKPASKS
jgi:hypothetical protein